SCVTAECSPSERNSVLVRDGSRRHLEEAIAAEYLFDARSSLRTMRSDGPARPKDAASNLRPSNRPIALFDADWTRCNLLLWLGLHAVQHALSNVQSNKPVQSSPIQPPYRGW